MLPIRQEPSVNSNRKQPRRDAGKPVIRNTRIPVELLLRKLGQGATIEDLLDP